MKTTQQYIDAVKKAAQDLDLPRYEEDAPHYYLVVERDDATNVAVEDRESDHPDFLSIALSSFDDDRCDVDTCVDLHFANA